MGFFFLHFNTATNNVTASGAATVLVQWRGRGGGGVGGGGGGDTLRTVSRDLAVGPWCTHSLIMRVWEGFKIFAK